MEAVIEKRSVGRPRKVRTDDVVIETETPKEEIKTVDEKPTNNGSGMLPYAGKDSLPLCVRDADGRVTKVGDSRYFMRSTITGVVELIRVFRNGNGVGRRLVRILKPRRQDRNDKAIIEGYLKQGIPLDRF